MHFARPERSEPSNFGRLILRVQVQMDARGQGQFGCVRIEGDIGASSTRVEQQCEVIIKRFSCRVAEGTGPKSNLPVKITHANDNGSDDEHPSR